MVLGLLAGTCCGLLSSQPSHAAGFYIQEQSVSGLGTSYAGEAAMPRDASVVFFNPAGLTHLDQRQVNIGMHIIAPHVELSDNGSTFNNGGGDVPLAGVVTTSDGGNPGSFSPIPNAYFAMPASDDGKLWIGAGLSAPFGLGSHYNDDFFGRYTSTRVKLQTLDFQMAAAYQVTQWLSMGSTFIVQQADADLKFYATNDTPSTLRGKDTSFGVTLGLLAEPMEGTKIGLTYRSAVEHELEGEIITQVPGLGASSAQADLDLPDIASLALSHKFADKWTALANVNWYGWNAFDKLTPVREDGLPAPEVNFNYQTSLAYGVGLEYEMNDKWTLRTGLQYDETPSTIEGRSTLNPDGDRTWLSFGGTYKKDEKWSFDFGATYIDIDEEPINQTRGGAGLPVVNVIANTDDAYVGIVGVAVNYKF